MIPVDKHKQLKSLPEERLRTVEQMMRRGDAAEEIATTIQKWGHLVQMKVPALRQAVIRYRTDIVRDQINELLNGKDLLDKATGLAKKLDALDEMMSLYYVQRARIQKLMLMEDELPALSLLTSHEALKEELGLANQMLKEISRLQLETGIMRRAPKSISVSPPDENGVVTYRVTEESIHALEMFMNEAGRYDVADT